LCDGCREIAPEVFRLNPAGYMEIVFMDRYPEELVDQAISLCPRDCIFWT
jgi:ferredoxin